MLAIIDYKAGNQTSVLRAFSSLGIPAKITSDNNDILNAEGVIFPGVGAAAQAMKQLSETGMDVVLRQAVQRNKPILGICLGCQILLESSEEGNTPTLGIVPGICRKFQSDWKDGDSPIRIPHMGWNTLEFVKTSILFDGVNPSSQFYFVHSYYVDTAPQLMIAMCGYGCRFTAVYGRPGLWAVQFHPEKSGKAGLRLLQNFYEYCRGK